jgi:transglutaminase-like putative cysteine protease/tetratricopeptide (TPR) repeat protein
MALRVISLLALALALLPGAVGNARAANGAVHDEVTRRLDAVVLARGPEVYARLRKLWQTWEVAPPTQVEEALAAVASDKRLTAPARVYAGLLEAYARRRRGDLDGATRRIDKLGFVRSWMVVGPFDNDNKSGLPERLVPELELSEPVLSDRSFDGKERPVRWRSVPDVHRWGYLDLGAMMRPNRDVCGYATTFVRAKAGTRATRKLSLWVGVTGAFKLFWNGDQIMEDVAYRQLDAERHALVVKLEDGYNRITVKVCADETSPAVALRIGNADGSVATGIEVAATEAVSGSAANSMRERTDGEKVAAKPGSKKVATLKRLGPVEAFSARLAKSPEDAKLLESYARYLLVTGGDPEASHQARDLSRRAAEAEPTVDRLLLAAMLAEDRNRRRGFIEQAGELASTSADRTAVLLDRARLARTGPNWRDAFPLYQKLLRMHPDSVPATLGMTDLYLEAGLKRTAIELLRGAVERQPHAVSLLRTYAAGLRMLGRDTDAAEIESRYAALRFDDGGYLSDQLDLAVARRDAEGARRWAARLLASESSSTWAHGVAARAHVALGDTAQGIATYERALAIAPEDVGTMRALSDMYGLLGKRDQQLAYLKRIVRIVPQAKDVRAYLEHIEPVGARKDEQYAWPAERFLEKRAVTDRQHPKRTLRKLTVSTVFANGLASHFHQVVFQPLTDEAAARARQYAFVYHSDRQIVQLRAAKVYRRDGRVDEAIESGSVPLNDPSINMYTLQRTYYVQFPRLNPGDVVELRYRVDDVAARNEMSDYFGEIQYMQSDEPIGSVEYVLIAPKDKRLHISVGPQSTGPQSTGPRSDGASSRQRAGTAVNVIKKVSASGNKKIYRFSATDVPPVQAEPRMARYAELLAHVHVSTFASWKDVGAWYWGLARDKLDVDDDVRQLARSLVAGKTTEQEKVAAIYHYAATETRYVALELGIEGIRPRRAALTLARGWGDCKDKATLIVSMLREVGVPAEIVLVRTGLRGDFDTTTASLATFDHAIAYVPSLDLYIDGTAEATGTAELPSMDRSSVALRITGGQGKLVRLPEPAAAHSRETHAYQLTLAKDGELTFEGELQNKGVGAPSWRRRYHAASTRRERVSSAIARDLGPVELFAGNKGLTISDLDALEEAVTVKIAGAASAKRDGAGYLVPMGPSFSLVGSFASRAKRIHDVVVGPRREHVESWTLKLPRGMRAGSAPKPAIVESAFGRFEIGVEERKDRVVVKTSLRLDKARIRPSEYAAWRRFCERVDAAAAPSVLVRP